MMVVMDSALMLVNAEGAGEGERVEISLTRAA